MVAGKRSRAGRPGPLRLDVTATILTQARQRTPAGRVGPRPGRRPEQVGPKLTADGQLIGLGHRQPTPAQGLMSVTRGSGGDDRQVESAVSTQTASKFQWSPVRRLAPGAAASTRDFGQLIDSLSGNAQLGSKLAV